MSLCILVTPDDLTGPGPSWCTRPHRCRCAEPGRMPCRRPCRSPQRCGGRRLRARTPISGRPPPRLRQPSRSRHGDRSGTARPLHGIPSGRDLDPFAWTPRRERVSIMGSITRITWMSGRPLIGMSGSLRRPDGGTTSGSESPRHQGEVACPAWVWPAGHRNYLLGNDGADDARAGAGPLSLHRPVNGWSGRRRTSQRAQRCCTRRHQAEPPGALLAVD